ncbi:MAG: electron transfer flavoprotein subunit alpha/FixB family protein [Deltaproteobacteria bacterium]|nr:electron transfer flavoprotein subunit alpha/FixB family protein [Deltaproteobacteria bacterium]
MKNIYVLAEHRKGLIRDTTWEAIAAGRKLSSELGAELTCILLSANATMAETLSTEAQRVMVVNDPIFETMNSEAVIKTLKEILKPSGSYVLLMGASNAILDFAPGLSVALDAALATDCFSVEVKNGKLFASRQMYSYKINSLVSFKDSERVVLTIRAGSFPFTSSNVAKGAVENVACPIDLTSLKKRFVKYVEAEKGDVDIASADIIISVGRGIGDEPDLDMFQSLADTMGGVLACSRPIVDKNLLPKFHQVGTSGVEVKPKVYLALGISGAFQHLGGIKGSPLLVAVNKDPRAPIFRVATYGIVGDLNEVVPVLDEKIKALKG